jgi:1-acylglycerone phosphate reductase
VRVITLITGGVATNFLTNLQPVTLPKDSYYTSIEKIIGEHPDDIPFAMKPELFALQVLRRVENGANGKYWIGGGSIMARLAMWLFPQSVLVGVVWARFILEFC